MILLHADCKEGFITGHVKSCVQCVLRFIFAEKVCFQVFNFQRN